MMAAVVADKFHRHLREIDIPPRKILNMDDAVFSKFLPNNTDEDDSDPYSSDHFRMYEFKVRKCSRSRSHDWTECPFVHPGEKARRRDPRRFHYSGTVCSEFRKGGCSKGDSCEASHGVFECWLHPSRYRTEACKDGKNCKRKVCFFAHTTRQLRIVPESPPSSPENKCRNPNPCCVYCHSMAAASPTSTLMSMSNSPPMSPSMSPYGGRRGEIGYKEALTELMASLNMNHSPKVSRFSGERKLLPGEYSGRNLMEEGRYNGEGSWGGPDLGWVKDLLT